MKVEILLEGIYKTKEHIKTFFEDAQKFEEEGRLDRAYTFYHFAFEEGGRLSMMLQVLYLWKAGKIQSKDLNYKTLKHKGYSDHISKLEKSILFLFKIPIYNLTMKYKDKEVEQLMKYYDELCSNKKNYNENKNRSLYVDFEDNEFKSPKEMISKDDLEEIKTLAEILVDTIDKNFNSFVPEKGCDLKSWKLSFLEKYKDRL